MPARSFNPTEMLYKTPDKASGKILKRSRPLLISPKDGYQRPGPGKAWFQTTTTIWRVDELIRRSVRDWRRLMNETGHTGSRSGTFRKDHDSVYTGTHSSFAAPLVEWILLRYGGSSGATILDAFAGGSPRAVISCIMGLRYIGIDIRIDQIKENEATLKELGLKGATYIHGDGRFIPDDVGPFDVALTCPPYFDLEQYSDQPDDLSNLGSYEEFIAGIYFSAMSHFKVMKPGAFVCWVVGPFRSKKTGELINFPGHTIEAFREAGFIYWQDVILSKNFGSAAKRSTNAWKGLKLVPIHEHLLVFRKPK